MPVFRTAYVTGASSGIGAEVARQLAARGTRVVLAARREPLLRALAAELRAAGGAADVAPLDVADAEAARAEVVRWDAEVGGLDLVLANAGVGEAQHAAELAFSEVERVLRVNALGACATLMGALECMRPRDRGTLGAVSSLAAYRGLPGSGAYSASKACLSTFLETLQVDLRRTGLRVVDVRPGFVRTPMTAAHAFKMPFVMDVGPAARRIVRALERGEALCAFPLPLWLAVGFAQALPNRLWRALAPLVRG